MSLSPNLEVQIYDFNEELKVVKMITLITWKHALKLELNGLNMSKQKVSTIVRKFLSAPRSYPVTDLADHIETCVADIHEQLGIESK